VLAVVLDGTTAVYTEGNELPAGADDTPTTSTRWPAPSVTELSVTEAMSRVLAEAGAFPRDADDAAYVTAVVDGTVPVGDQGTVLPPIPTTGHSPVLRVLGASPGDGVVPLAYAVPAPGIVRLEIFDVTGRLVARLVEDLRSTGRGDATWDGASARGVQAPSGVYVARLTWRQTERVTAGAGPSQRALSAEARVVRLR
jgi:hypothetical protein